MKCAITHIAVYVADLEKSREYYMTFFGGKSNERYQNNKGFSSYFLAFDGGVRLEIMHHTQLERREPIDKVTGWSHVAFSVDDEQTVIQLTERIVAAGYALYSPPRRTGDGYFESCVGDPDGNRVEITT